MGGHGGCPGQIDTALFFNPEMGEAYFYKGYVLYGIDTTGMDRSLFDQAISQGFTDPWAYYYRGITSIREGLYESALEDFNKAIGLREDFALAYHERAGVKRKLGDLQGPISITSKPLPIRMILHWLTTIWDL
jgi:tetratricopeptide (TPR) repeat protein